MPVNAQGGPIESSSEYLIGEVGPERIIYRQRQRLWRRLLRALSAGKRRPEADGRLALLREELESAYIEGNRRGDVIASTRLALEDAERRLASVRDLLFEVCPLDRYAEITEELRALGVDV